MYKVEVSPWTFPEALDRVAIALDLNRAQFDHDITGVNAGEVLLRVRHPGRGTVHVEVSRQGSEPCIYASALVEEDVDVIGGHPDASHHR